MTDAELEQLIAEAEQISQRAHAPYSKFHVGAALLTARGGIYRGCNVENASYGATVCAERNAIAQMVAAGEHELRAVAVFVPAPQPALPCGICRQALVEFVDDAVIVCANPSGRIVTSLAELLPQPFKFRR